MKFFFTFLLYVQHVAWLVDIKQNSYYLCIAPALVKKKKKPFDTVVLENNCYAMAATVIKHMCALSE